MVILPRMTILRLRPMVPLVHLSRPETGTLLGGGLDTLSPGEVDFMMVDFRIE
jgi:hypothetical protein